MGTFRNTGLVGLVLWGVACGGAPEAEEGAAPAGARLEALSAETGLSRAQLIVFATQRTREHQACSPEVSFLGPVSEDGAQEVRTRVRPPEGSAVALSVSALLAPAPSWCVPGSSCTYCGGSCAFGGRVSKGGTKSWDGASCYCTATVYPWDYWNSCGC